MDYLTSYFASKKWIKKQAEVKGMQKAIKTINNMEILSTNIKKLVTDKLKKEMK